MQFNFTAHIGPGIYSDAVALHQSENHVGKNFDWQDHHFGRRTIRHHRERQVQDPGQGRYPA